MNGSTGSSSHESETTKVATTDSTATAITVSTAPLAAKHCNDIWQVAANKFVSSAQCFLGGNLAEMAACQRGNAFSSADLPPPMYTTGVAMLVRAGSLIMS